MIVTSLGRIAQGFQVERIPSGTEAGMLFGVSRFLLGQSHRDPSQNLQHQQIGYPGREETVVSMML